MECGEGEETRLLFISFCTYQGAGMTFIESFESRGERDGDTQREREMESRRGDRGEFDRICIQQPSRCVCVCVC